jgi:hypothetical protein
MATTPIIEALGRVRRTRTAGSHQALKDLVHLLDHGADPNEPDEHGLRPLDFFHTNERARNARQPHHWHYLKALDILAARGADPMLPGCQFIQKGDDTQIMSFMVAVSKQTWRRPEGAAPFCDNQNPLHGLMKTVYMSLPNFVTGQYCEKNWLNQARGTDGATPLHVMWQNELINDFPKHPRWQKGPLTQAYWEVSFAMEEGGALLDTPDQQGVCVLDLMTQMLELGMDPPEGQDDRLGKLMARTAQLKLGRDTAPAGPAPRKARL